jgi:hypothetical protein
VAAGLPNKEIAIRLHLSPRTVEKHVESLLRKAGASSRTMLVAVTGPWPHQPAARLRSPRLRGFPDAGAAVAAAR